MYLCLVSPTKSEILSLQLCVQFLSDSVCEAAATPCAFFRLDDRCALLSASALAAMRRSSASTIAIPGVACYLNLLLQRALYARVCAS